MEQILCKVQKIALKPFCTTGVQLASKPQPSNSPHKLTCPQHFESTKVNYEFFPKADAVSSFVPWRLLSHNTPCRKPRQATQLPSDYLHWIGCTFQQCHLAVSIFSGFGGEGTATNPRLLQGLTRDSIEVEQHISTKEDWLAIDIVFVFAFARTKVAPPGKVYEGPQGVDFDESAPGDSDTFIWMEYRHGRESQFSNKMLERYGTLDILLMGEIRRTTRDV